MSERAHLLDLMEETAQAVSHLGVLLREQARLLRTEQDTGDALLSYEDAAARLDVSKKTVTRLVRAKQLAVVMVGARRPKVAGASLSAYMERRRVA